jgi:hypothetical protein
MKPFQYNKDPKPQNRSQSSTLKTMRTNITSRPLTRRSRFAVAAFAACVLMSALIAPSQIAADSNPPNLISYKGYLTDTSGNPLESSGPMNHVIIFRIYNVLQGGAALWTEQQTVTIDNGVFSVLLGAGSQYSNESHELLHTVFQGNDASDRYIGITVDTGGSELAPRMQFLSSAYAQLARNAATADSLRNGFVNTVSGGGIEIINSSGTPTSRTPSTPWHLSSKTVLTATQGIFDWHMMMKDTDGNLQWADANSADGRVEMELRTGSGNLWLKGQLITEGSVVVDNSRVTLPANPSNGDREFFRVQRGAGRWNMFTDTSGSVYWADESYDGVNPHFTWNKNGSFKAQGRITTNQGVVVDNSNTTPAARNGSFDPAWKRVLTATQGINDWHIMMDDVSGAGNLLFADANVGDGALEMILQRGSGNLTIKGKAIAGEGIVIGDPTGTPTVRDGAPFDPTWKGLLTSTIGANDWHIMMDSQPLSGNLIFADANNNEGPSPWEMVLYRGSGNLSIKGALIEQSDRRLKKNIEYFGSGVLAKLTALRPVKYNWKRDEDNAPKDLGLIAQDVQKLFPEVVSTSTVSNGELEDTLGISYNRLGVLAVSAIKELHEETKREDALLHGEDSLLREEVESLREENGALSDQLREMQVRLNALENKFL